MPRARSRLTQAGQPPENSSLSGNLEGSDAWGCALVWPGHAAGVQEKHAVLLFIARHVRVAVQEDVDILWRLRRRNMNEAAADSVSFQVNRQGPLKVGVAIAADKR